MHKCGSWFDFIISLIESVLRFTRGICVLTIFTSLALFFLRFVHIGIDDADLSTIKRLFGYSAVGYAVTSTCIYFINCYFVTCVIMEAEEDWTETDK